MCVCLKTINVASKKLFDSISNILDYNYVGCTKLMINDNNHNDNYSEYEKNKLN